MLGETKLYEDEFTEKEYSTVRQHQNLSHELKWYDMMRAWRDEKGILCVQYKNGSWYHYNEHGEWW